MLTAKAVTLLKIEVSNNVDPSPTATDAVITTPVKWSLLAADIQRNVVLPYFGKLADIPVGVGIELSFGMELFGSGVKDSAPKQGLLFRAAGFSETVNAGTSVVYAETSTQDCESITVYFYNDGILYKASGCVVDSAKLNFTANKTVTMEVKLSGMFAGVATNITDVALITPTFGTPQIPPVFASASLAFETGMGNVSKVEIDITNKIVKRPDPNAASGVKRISIVDRDIKGSMDPEMTALATWNPWSLWAAGTAAALSFNLGGTTGNKYTFSLPSVNKAVPQIGDKGGIRDYALSFVSNPTLAAGNNRLTISHV